MSENKLIQQVGDNIKLLAKDFGLANDLEENLKSVLVALIRKLDLVTREEFDIQQKVLLATRKKLDELETLLNRKNS